MNSIGGGKTWERTSALRWKSQSEPFLDGDKIKTCGPILQQGWWCRETGETEWRTIEVVP